MKRLAATVLVLIAGALLFWPISPSIAPFRNSDPNLYPAQLVDAIADERAESHAIRLLNDRGSRRGLMRQLALALQSARARLFAGDDRIAAFLIESSFYLYKKPGVAYWADTCLGKALDELQESEIEQAVQLLRLPKGECLTP